MALAAAEKKTVKLVNYPALDEKLQMRRLVGLEHFCGDMTSLSPRTSFFPEHWHWVL
jgi:hypothetical protein